MPSSLQVITCLVLSAFGAYAGGRIHQWYNHVLDRDRSFREGYRHGYSELFPIASRGSWRPPAPDDQSPEPPRD